MVYVVRIDDVVDVSFSAVSTLDVVQLATNIGEIVCWSKKWYRTSASNTFSQIIRLVRLFKISVPTEPIC